MRFCVPLALVFAVTSTVVAAPAKPNIVFILADDIGYGDLGCYGQKKIRTPNIDRLAAEGIRFTDAYSGSTVCAPSRCCLMTGLHTGHARIRGNKRGATLLPEDRTVAKLLQEAGYATACIGKWGLGDPGELGVPSKQGFDTFFGYLNHGHAHNYYPEHLWRHEEKVPLKNISKDGVASERVEYAPDLFLKESLTFIEANKGKPFFLYFASTIPHANNERTKATGEGNEIPSDEPYSKEDWPQPERNKAAMITRFDADVGKIMAKLKELDIEKNTLIVFSSDNGPHKEGGNDPKFFNSSGPFRGIKRSLTDGGIRVPFIVRWVGTTKSGTVSDHVTAFWDFLPTVAELTGMKIASDLDGLSIAPIIVGTGNAKVHEFMYWEFHEGGTKQAVRDGQWKGIRLSPNGPLELYDLINDVGEVKNVANDHPMIIERITEYLKTARTESKEFPIVQPKR